MKKRAVGVLLAVCMAVTPAFAAKAPEAVQVDYSIENVTSKAVVAASDPAQNANYVCTDSVQYNENGEKDAYWKYKYNADGFLLRKTFFDANGSMYYYVEYAYDKYGNLAQEIQFAPNGTIKSTETWTYDSRGNLLEWKKSDSDTIFYWYTYEYDSQDNVTKEITLDSNGTPLYWTENTYDSDGNLREQKKTENGIVTYQSIFVYDSDTSVWEHETYKGEFSRLIHHTFNDQGQETIVTYCNEDGTPTTSWNENIYDKNGNFVRHEMHYGEQMTYSTEYEFDDQSRLIRQTDRLSSGNGWVNADTCWEYDAQGNAVKETHYNADGTIDYSIENTYTSISGLTAVNIFPDINDGNWFTPYVNYCYDHGLMAGTGTNFSPNDQLSRAMFVQILYNAEGKPKVTGKSSFSDVKEGAWYYNAVVWAEQNNVSAGIGNGKFGTNAVVSREQLATMLHNYEGKPKADATAISKYPDAAKVSGWAVNGVSWAVSSGIITGSAQKDGSIILNPKGTATRAQAATILSKYISGNQ